MKGRDIFLLGLVLLFGVIVLIRVNLGDAAGTAAGETDEYFSAFALQRLDGGEFTQDDLAATKLTVINGWAPWCRPCVNELPELQALSAELEDSGVRIVCVVADYYSSSGVQKGYLNDVEKTVGDLGLTLPVLLSDERFEAGPGRMMNNMFPGTWAVDSEGRIVGFRTGSAGREEWRRIIDGWLGKAA